jgi:pantothenate kinase (EC 2.7.1.33)
MPGLLTDEVAAAIDAVEEAGGDAAMAMLGNTVFAVGDGLSAAGYDPHQCDTDAGGARLREGSTDTADAT